MVKVLSLILICKSIQLLSLQAGKLDIESARKEFVLCGKNLQFYLNNLKMVATERQKLALNATLEKANDEFARSSFKRKRIEEIEGKWMEEQRH